MTTVFATGNGAIRARIDASGAALALFRPGERNRIVRESLVLAGKSWIKSFLPRRFSPYVKRAPFNYPKNNARMAITKLRSAESDGANELAAIYRRILSREFFGWDPWGNKPIPRELEDKWMSTNASRYGKARRARWLDGANIKKMHHDIRAWAKNKVRDYAVNLSADDVMLPLVYTGDLRDGAIAGARSRAISTASKTQLTITIPRGGRQNHWAVRILGELPGWEFDYIVANFGSALNASLQGGLTARFAGSVDGRSTGAGQPRPTGAGKARK
jgi:hypothetical protein